jgi:hypothetical protein
VGPTGRAYPPAHNRSRGAANLVRPASRASRGPRPCRFFSWVCSDLPPCISPRPNSTKSVHAFTSTWAARAGSPPSSQTWWTPTKSIDLHARDLYSAHVASCSTRTTDLGVYNATPWHPFNYPLLCVQGPGDWISVPWLYSLGLHCRARGGGGRKIRVPLLAREAAWPRLVARGILTGVADFGSRLEEVAGELRSRNQARLQRKTSGSSLGVSLHHRWCARDCWGEIIYWGDINCSSELLHRRHTAVCRGRVLYCVETR